MKKAFLIVLLCTGIANVAMAGFDPHRFQVKTFDEWASTILERFPFKNGVLTHKQYEIFASAYQNSMIDFYKSVAERKMKDAERAGRSGVIGLIQQRLDTQIEQIKSYVSTTEAGIFQSLDPLHSDMVTLSEARRQLLKIARAADMNSNGILEPIEIDIAEAILIRGIDINDPNALHIMLRDLDRHEAWEPQK